MSTAPWVPIKTVLITTQSPLVKYPANAKADAVIHTNSLRDVSFSNHVSKNPLCSAISYSTATSPMQAHRATPNLRAPTSLRERRLLWFRSIRTIPHRELVPTHLLHRWRRSPTLFLINSFVFPLWFFLFLALLRYNRISNSICIVFISSRCH